MMRLNLILLMVLGFLAACGSDKTRNEGQLVAKAALKQLFSPKPAAAQAPVLSRAAIDAGGNPLVRARIEKGGATAYLGKIGENSGAITWASADGLTVSLRNGVVLATRGMGTDLMSAQVPEADVLAQGAAHQRRHYYLFGGETEQLRTFDCTMSQATAETIIVAQIAYATQHRTESCTGTDGAMFDNQFWFGNRGIIRQSRQWISPDVGFLELQDLNR